MNLHAHGGYRHRLAAADLQALKDAHPILDVVGSYGVELRRQGRAYMGRCPFHADAGRPNLYVWSETATWWCFRCCVGGDSIRFVELAEKLSFRDAVQRLGQPSLGSLVTRVSPQRRSAPGHKPSYDGREPEELRALEAATSLYHQRLLTDERALLYLAGRGVSHNVVMDCRLGYASGEELLAYLQWRSLPAGPAIKVGLLDGAGREFLAGRIVVPELRAGRPVWLVGRTLEPACSPPADELPAPKYLALPGARPLLGFERARGFSTVMVTEGVLDFVIARGWGYPAVGLMGTHVSPAVIEQLRQFQRVYLVLDQDHAGVAATLRLIQTLGPAAVPVTLPAGIKDVADLAPSADGPQQLAAALLAAAGVEPDAVSVGTA
jgi:DNA primase